MKTLKRLLKPTPFLVGLVLSLLASSYYYYMGGTKYWFLAALDKQIYDAMFRVRGDEAPSGEVVIVDIDEKSLKKIGQWPWPRDLMAVLVEKITEAGAYSMGFDMVFPEHDRLAPAFYYHTLQERMPGVFKNTKPEILSDPRLNFDARFGDSLSKAPSCLGYVFTFSGGQPAGEAPFPSASIRILPRGIGFEDINLIKASGVILNNSDVSQAGTEGFINVVPDLGGVIHRVPLFITYNNVPYPSIALETVRTGLNLPEIIINASTQKTSYRNAVLGISLSERFIPTDNECRIAINYRGRPRVFPTLSAVDIINGEGLYRLKNKFVFVGTSAAGLHDLRSTPFSGSVPGVEIQANVADNILKGDPFIYDRLAEIALTYLTIIIGGSLMGFLLSYTGPFTSALVGIGAVSILVVGDFYLYFMQRKLVGMVYPVLVISMMFITITLFKYFFQDREKRFIFRAFSQYVSPGVVNQLMLHPESLSLQGEQRNITVFFSDIRNFTGISENMTSSRLAKILNLYLTAMSNIILEHNGMVDKYIGDAIMAIWNAPHEDKFHAANAIKSALRMQSALHTLGEEWKKSGFPLITAGMGINTGDLNVGNFGSDQRFEYTVIGDEVNLASRLEGLNKNYGTDILVSESSMMAAGDGIFFRYVDTVRVKGKEKSIRIFEPICEDTPSQDVVDEVAAFEAAVHFYRKMDFVEAGRIINELNAANPSRLYMVYLDRISGFISDPPPENWDGVHVFSEK
ncbi:CHASE2 domain-containing protein [Desulforegula conservatrix]|uniref:CHASE2 domain-containing protein n=1 Tax=Desulforegula conservatrix TaxID=153026 RepID=UPI0003FC5598|nr:adenylate/guanylate cyclase domain-containing protein [Desulforegula conservatrix]